MRYPGHQLSEGATVPGLEEPEPEDDEQTEEVTRNTGPAPRITQ